VKNEKQRSREGALGQSEGGESKSLETEPDREEGAREPHESPVRTSQSIELT